MRKRGLAANLIVPLLACDVYDNKDAHAEVSGLIMFNFSHKIEEIKSSLIGFVLMLACTILGIIWLSVALYNYLTQSFGTIAGPAICGVVLFAPIAIYLVIKAVHKQDKRSKKQKMFDEAFAATPVGSLSRMIESMSAHSPFAAAAVAILGGFLASRFPQFLSMFTELVSALGEELTRRKATHTVNKARKAAGAKAFNDSETPPPPDVEPVTKRRGKAKVDAY